MPRTFWFRVLCGWLASTAMSGAAQLPARFDLSGELRPLQRSEDGRFAVAAELRMTPEDTSVDGRYTLKSVHAPEAGCELDGVFANGFE